MNGWREGLEGIDAYRFPDDGDERAVQVATIWSSDTGDRRQFWRPKPGP